ncbi:MAG: hypothetical protein IJC11_06760 [Alphaproteobacteria bacterium]|nr:hypothetical protein [Alphaproteobacteria bacterium]
MDYGALCGHLKIFFGNNNDYGLFRTTLTPEEETRLRNNFEGGNFIGQVSDFIPGRDKYSLLDSTAYKENLTFIKSWQKMTLDERKKLVELCLKLHESNTEESRSVADSVITNCNPKFLEDLNTLKKKSNETKDYNFDFSTVNGWLQIVKDGWNEEKYPYTVGKELLLTIQNQLNQQQPENTQEALPAINSEQQPTPPENEQQPATFENEEKSPIPGNNDELKSINDETSTTKNDTRTTTSNPITLGSQTTTPGTNPSPQTPDKQAQPQTPAVGTTPSPQTPTTRTRTTTPSPKTPDKTVQPQTPVAGTTTPGTQVAPPEATTEDPKKKKETDALSISAQAAVEQKSFWERNWQWIVGAVAAVAAAIGAYFLLKKQKKKTKEAKNEVNSLKEQVSTLQDKINELSENGNNSTNNNNNSGNSNSDNSSSGLAGNSTRIYTHDEIIADINLLRSSNNSTSNG